MKDKHVYTIGPKKIGEEELFLSSRKGRQTSEISIKL